MSLNEMNNRQKKTSQFKNELSLSDIFYHVKSNLKIFIFCIFLSTLLAFIYSELRGSKYIGSIFISLPKIAGVETTAEDFSEKLSHKSYYSAETINSCNMNLNQAFKRHLIISGKKSFVKISVLNKNQSAISNCLDLMAKNIYTMESDKITKFINFQKEKLLFLNNLINKYNLQSDPKYPSNIYLIPFFINPLVLEANKIEMDISEFSTSNIQIILPVDIEIIPTLNQTVLIFLGLLGGGFFGIILILLKTYKDNK